MKKIMFSDRFGLTQAVLDGRKTMTRRIVPDGVPLGNWSETLKKSRYQPGEVVAVAQSYHSLNKSGYVAPEWLDHYCEDSAGYENKMFVRADLMPHQIRITNVRIERLQDISDEDCLREGIYNWKDAPDCPSGHKDSKIECYGYDGSWDGHLTPITAFAALIDKVSGKGTWQANPYCFCYEFELVK